MHQQFPSSNNLNQLYVQYPPPYLQPHDPSSYQKQQSMRIYPQPLRLQESGQQSKFQMSNQPQVAIPSGQCPKKCLVVSCVLVVIIGIMLWIILPLTLSQNDKGNIPCTYSINQTIQVEMSWVSNTNDLDLHVYEPDGTHVYHGRKKGHSGELQRDVIRAPGPQVYQTFCISEGSYIIQVANYYGGSTTAAFKVRAGNTTFENGVSTSSPGQRKQGCVIQVSKSNDTQYQFDIHE